MKQYTTKERSPKQIEFELDGEVFTFTAPKQSMMLLDMFRHADGRSMTDLDATRSQFNWLGAGLSEEQGQRIYDRLADPEDPLEWLDLQPIVHDLMAEVSGRPTKRRSD